MRKDPLARALALGRVEAERAPREMFLVWSVFTRRELYLGGRPLGARSISHDSRDDSATILHLAAYPPELRCE